MRQLYAGCMPSLLWRKTFKLTLNACSLSPSPSPTLDSLSGCWYVDPCTYASSIYGPVRPLANSTNRVARFIQSWFPACQRKPLLWLILLIWMTFHPPGQLTWHLGQAAIMHCWCSGKPKPYIPLAEVPLPHAFWRHTRAHLEFPKRILGGRWPLGTKRTMRICYAVFRGPLSSIGTIKVTHVSYARKISK